MPGFRRIDAFVKNRPDIQQKNVAGGIITLLAACTAGLLFLGQIYLYVTGNPVHSLYLAKSYSLPLLPLGGPNSFSMKLLQEMTKIPLELKVTFYHLRCSNLDFSIDGASRSSGKLAQIYGHEVFTLRTPGSRELREAGAPHDINPSHTCTVHAKLKIPVVAGSLSIGMTRRTWAETTGVVTKLTQEGRQDQFPEYLQAYNISHFIHYARFGDPFPYASAKPLEQRKHVVENHYSGLAVESISVKLVPTTMDGVLFGSTDQRRMYQASVATHTIQPSTLVQQGVPHLPGLVLNYDFTPLAVHHSSGRDNFLVFLSSLVSIVGGVFVTVGLISGCLLQSAKVVAKKID